MSKHTPYGFCRGGCGKWIPRDEMISINVVFYSAEKIERKLRIRLCADCRQKFEQDIADLRWDKILKAEMEIRASMELAAKSDLEYDPSLAEQKISYPPVDKTKKPMTRMMRHRRALGKAPLVEKTDDSEAAMRRQGRHVDVSY